MNTFPEIVFEDESLLVVEKPAGMIVNRADTTRDVATLQDLVEKYFKSKNIELKKSGEDIVVDGYSKSDEFINRSGIVHRLDKETSGIIIVAKDVASFVGLQKQFKNGTVKKTYLALVHGRVMPEEGEISVPIGRLPWNRKRFGVISEGREAKTLYRVLEYREFNHDKKTEEVSLVEVYPQTGRTHQIRVHFQYLNHPIFSDELYAGRKISRDDRKFLKRHFLHAARISFLHPVTQKSLNLEAALPEDLTEFISSYTKTAHPVA